MGAIALISDLMPTIALAPAGPVDVALGALEAFPHGDVGFRMQGGRGQQEGKREHRRNEGAEVNAASSYEMDYIAIRFVSTGHGIFAPAITQVSML